MLAYRLDGEILEVKESVMGWNDTKVSYWYYDIRNWLVSNLGKQNEVPTRPMTPDGIEWVSKYYLPKVIDLMTLEQRERFMKDANKTQDASRGVHETEVAFNAAINFALDKAGPEGLNFLHVWREGDWDSIAEEWPEFDLSTVDDTKFLDPETLSLLDDVPTEAGEIGFDLVHDEDSGFLNLFVLVGDSRNQVPLAFEAEADFRRCEMAIRKRLLSRQEAADKPRMKP